VRARNATGQSYARELRAPRNFRRTGWIAKLTI
jgi:hypothetical protein